MMEDMIANVENGYGQKLSESDKKIAEEMIEKGCDSGQVVEHLRNCNTPYYY